MKSCTFIALGRPSAQGSKRYVGRGIMLESSKTLPAWRTVVRDAAQAARPATWDLSGPMGITIDLIFARPKNHLSARGGLVPSAPRHHVARVCDVDKGARAILDALTGVLWLDDAQVITLTVSRVYASSSEPEHALISVTDLSTAP